MLQYQSSITWNASNNTDRMKTLMIIIIIIINDEFIHLNGYIQTWIFEIKIPRTMAYAIPSILILNF